MVHPMGHWEIADILQKVLWSLPTFYEKNIAFMRKNDTGHTYERPFIKLVDLYTQLYRQVP
ncbi:uncharacterized protein LACBIDRAFT_314929 [Laccaria bicolor S238N-H82]|uniref:Predicted protein n=1 Tax=Laccaria bicolor (strain S238N-H82 / ATCC MYA-4686) TaxID=486041 RepID=B0DZH1_LACBS|nr:uncharacterized protein LACBIDRAFT_314929 [Laccaria bicolor S238N-H82]EDR00018.1 predicted protein [Laccaria bicolor S238N-H82]|eukprot:XP_001889327.1 predicted protein [Laccaria bicolor S238N-H82]